MSRKRRANRRVQNTVVQEIKRTRGKPVGTRIAAKVHRTLQHGAADGGWDDKKALADLERQALIQIVDQELRRQKIKATVVVGGQTVRTKVAARYGVRGRTGRGAKTTVVQYPMWMNEPWSTVETLRSDVEREQDQAALKLAVFDAVLALKDLYPAARTPLEALKLAGIDHDTNHLNLASGE